MLSSYPQLWITELGHIKKKVHVTRGLLFCASTQKEDEQKTQHNRDGKKNIECISGLAKWQMLEIHSIETGHQCRHHKNDGYYSKSVYKSVKIIRDDRGIGLHCSTQDIGINVGHFQCLTVIYDDIFKKIGMQLIISNPKKICSLHLHHK